VSLYFDDGVYPRETAKKDISSDQDSTGTASSGTTPPAQPPPPPQTWHVHDIAMTNIGWGMSYIRDIGGGPYIAQWSCNSLALGEALHMGGEPKG